MSRGVCTKEIDGRKNPQRMGGYHQELPQGCIFSRMMGFNFCVETSDGDGCPFPECIYDQDSVRRFNHLRQRGVQPIEAIGIIIKDRGL